MRRLFFLILGAAILFFIARRISRSRQIRELLIEDMLRSLEKGYRESGEASSEFLLNRLRQIRARYGDKIAQEIAGRLKEKLNEKETRQDE